MTVIQRFGIFNLPILRDHRGNVTKPIQPIAWLERATKYRTRGKLLVETNTPDVGAKSKV
jgi:hypothetical protein